MIADVYNSRRKVIWTPVKEQLRDVAQQSPLMTWLCEPDGYAIYMNPLWCAYTGQSEVEALGLGWTEAVHPDDRARAFEVYIKSATLMLPYQAEYRVRRKGGNYEWVTSSAQPFFDDACMLLGYVGSDASRETILGVRDDFQKVLTLREREAVNWAAQGLTSAETSVQMGITPRTVESFLTCAAIKMGATNRTQTVVEAIRRGEIDL